LPNLPEQAGEIAGPAAPATPGQVQRDPIETLHVVVAVDVCFGWKADVPGGAFASCAFSCQCKEKIMNMTRPGNEPDAGDMATEPGPEAPNDEANTHDLPDDEAEKLGNFA
jgi:hypothetical protein